MKLVDPAAFPASAPRTAHAPLRSVPATQHRGGERSPRTEVLAEEVPVALFYNGRSHAVMMATPQDLDDFAYGFSLTEGIAAHVDDVEIVDRLHRDSGIALHMLIPRHRAELLDWRQRNLTGRTGCGLCGASTLDAAIRPVQHVRSRVDCNVDDLLRAFGRLEALQRLNDRCGALHAAGLLLADDELLMREDVGRHNAVDKVLGAGARRGRAPRALLVTSRASYEVVHKAAQAGCPLVAAISAPTALAVRVAEQAGITLVGFARQDRLTVYTGDLQAAAAVSV